MAEFVYILCAATSIACAVLLTRQYLRRRTALLLWSALGFGGLSLNNVILCIDLIVVPNLDLSIVRSVTALISLGFILFGLVWDSGASRQ